MQQRPPTALRRTPRRQIRTRVRLTAFPSASPSAFETLALAGSIPLRGCIIAIARGARQANVPPCCRSATARMQRLQPLHIASMFCTRTPMGTQLVNSNTIPA
jgi:hypothetical protein